MESEKLIPLAEAMYEGGIRLMEITYSANGLVSDEDTAKNIEMLSKTKAPLSSDGISDEVISPIASALMM